MRKISLESRNKRYKKEGIKECRDCGIIQKIKLFPKGAIKNSYSARCDECKHVHKSKAKEVARLNDIRETQRTKVKCGKDDIGKIPYTFNDSRFIDAKYKVVSELDMYYDEKRQSWYSKKERRYVSFLEICNLGGSIGRNAVNFS